MRRPAAVDALDDNQIRVGIPAYVDDDSSAAFKSRYFFAELVRYLASPSAFMTSANPRHPAAVLTSSTCWSCSLLTSCVLILLTSIAVAHSCTCPSRAAYEMLMHPVICSRQRTPGTASICRHRSPKRPPLTSQAAQAPQSLTDQYGRPSAG